MLTEKEIVIICRQEIVRSQGWDTDHLSENRKQAFDYFYSRPRGDEIEGRSSIQSTDVSDMIEAVMSNINPILTNETLIQFKASGQDDEAQAQQESDYVAEIIGGQNDGYVEITSAVKDSLLLRNGFIKVWVDEVREHETFRETNIQEFEVKAIVNESDLEHTIKIKSLDDAKDGEGFDVTFDQWTHHRDLMVKAIAPENIVFSPEHDTPYVDDIRMLGERKLLTQTELINMGYPKKVIKKLPSYDYETKQDAVSRRTDEQSSHEAADPANRIIETFDLYIRIDKDETGISKLRHIHLATHEILLDEPAPWVPYGTGSPFIVPHRLYDQSVFDKLKSIEDSKTHFLRQWHDNARVVNNSRLVYNPKETTEADVVTSRPGGGIRSKNPQNVVALNVSDMGPSILSALEYMDKQRSERGGASLDLGAAELQLAGGNIGQGGADRQISVKEQLAAQMTATLANTLIRSVYLLVHKTLREHLPGEITTKLNGKWQTIDPSKWPERKSVKVMTGMSKGEKIQRISALTNVIQTQVSFMQQGKEGEIVSGSGIFNAIMDWARAANLENPEQYWVDPSSEEAQAAAKGKAEQAQAQQQAQAEAQQQQIQFQQEIFAMQSELQKYTHDTELMFKWAKERLDAEIEEAKLVGAATLDLERQQQIFTNQAQQQKVSSNANEERSNGAN